MVQFCFRRFRCARPPFPITRSEIDADPTWLLRKLETEQGLAAGTFKGFVSAAPPREKNKADHTFLATILNESGERVLRVVVKSCFLRMPRWFRIFASMGPSPEYIFYTRIQKELQFIDDGKPFLSAPRSLLTLDSRPHTHHFVVLEFVEGEVYRDSEGADPEHAKKMLQAVATLHAFYWGARSPTCQSLKGSAINLVDNCISLTKFKPLWQALRDYLAEYLPSTLCHGDCRLGNTLWPSDESQANSVLFLDWEMHMRTDALWDVVYFLWSSVPPKSEAASGEGSLSTAEMTYVEAWRERVNERLPSGSSPLPADLLPLLLCAQLRFMFYIGILAALNVAAEWQDNNDADHLAWAEYITRRSERYFEAEVMHSHLSKVLDVFRPNSAPFLPLLQDLASEAEKARRERKEELAATVGGVRSEQESSALLASANSSS